MEFKNVYTQAELEQAIADSFIPVCRGNVEFTATGNSQVTAYGNSQVRAYDHSQVTATGNSQVTATGNSQVRATPYVAVTINPAHKGTIAGGVQIKPPPIKTAEEWCEFYDVPVEQGIAILYKGVDVNFKTGRGFAYVPGTKPNAPDWDGGEAECGGGLHFSPSPAHTLSFEPDAKHFIACPVAVKDIVVHFPADYPEKVKAPGLAAPCYEVDIDGQPVAAAVAESVRTCMGQDQQNALQKWYNPTTGRTAFLCQMPDGKFGLQIGYENAGENKFTELTNFVKEQLKRLEQVEKYLRNRGYQPVGK